MNKQSSALYKQIYRIVTKIPYGKVATYKQIACRANIGDNPRLVGYALNKLPDGMDIPWHRVINSRGEVSYAASRNGHDFLQRELLIGEGIRFDEKGIINLTEYGWK